MPRPKPLLGALRHYRSLVVPSLSEPGLEQRRSTGEPWLEPAAWVAATDSCDEERVAAIYDFSALDVPFGLVLA